MQCPECKEPGRFPWQHGADCVRGLRQRIRWNEMALMWLLTIALGEALLLVAAYFLVGGVP